MHDIRDNRNIIGLKEQRAIVTGGSKGLGRAIAERLKESGAEVWIWDLEPPVDPDPGMEFVQVDVTDPGSISLALTHMGLPEKDVHILVNNAGIAGLNMPLWEHPWDRWQEVIEVNLMGTVHCLRQVLPHMLRSGYGRVLNLGSVAGKEGNANGAAYSASKGAVIALTKSVAKETATRGVLVNSIAPAAFDTDILATDEERKTRLLSRIPMGRLGRPDELAAMAAWIVSPDNSFTTGATFDISGGRASY